MAVPVGGVLPADRKQPQPLGLGEAAPDAVGLVGGQGVRRAFGPYRAGSAQGLGLELPAVAR